MMRSDRKVMDGGLPWVPPCRTWPAFGKISLHTNADTVHVVARTTAAVSLSS